MIHYANLTLCLGSRQHYFRHGCINWSSLWISGIKSFFLLL